MNHKQPLISVNILSYNRKEKLNNSLSKVLNQNYKNIEIIVVDNASTDGTVEMLKEKYPQVKVIKLKKNIGTSAINEGFRISKGEYILILDDDSYPLNDTIEKGVNVFLTNSQIGIVSFEIFNNYSNKTQTDNFIKNGISFIGCGALLLKELVHKLNGYSELFFLFHNELDFSIKTLTIGYKIIYLENAKIIHNQKVELKNLKKINPLVTEFRYYNYFISYSIFLIKNFSFKNYYIVLVKWLINRGIICFKYPMFSKSFFKAIIKILSNLKYYINSKNIAPNNIQKLYFPMIPIVDRDYFPNFKNRI